jgi:hypothetical protein
VPDGSITSTKLAPGDHYVFLVVEQHRPRHEQQRERAARRVSHHGRNAGVSLIGNGSQISTYGSDGLEQIRLWGTGYGELLLNNGLANNATAVRLTAQSSIGGQLELRNTNGNNRVLLEGENSGGLLTLYTSDGNIGAVLYGNEGAGSGALSLRNTNGSARFRAYGGPASGRMSALNAAGAETVDIDSEPAGIVVVRNSAGGTRAYMTAGGTQGGEIRNYEEDGTLTTIIHNVSDAGVVSVRNSSGIETGYLWGRNSAGQTGGQLGLKNSAGEETVTLNGDVSGEGRIYTQVLTVTGGSDLSENFNINESQAEARHDREHRSEKSGRVAPQPRALRLQGCRHRQRRRRGEARDADGPEGDQGRRQASRRADGPGVLLGGRHSRRRATGRHDHHVLHARPWHEGLGSRARVRQHHRQGHDGPRFRQGARACAGVAAMSGN